MKKIIIAIIYSLSWFFSFSQKENNKWIFSTYLLNNSHSLVDFNNGYPDTSTVLSPVDIFLTDASICDTNGNLLFYTNGNIIYNRNHDTLQNGAGINPGWLTNYYLPAGMGVPQGAFIIPYPEHPGQYLVFYESGELCPVGNLIASQPVFFPYSVIDMNLDGGMGGIVPGKKDLHAFEDTLIYGRITGTKHANGRDWWIVTHKSNTDIYDILLVTPDTMIWQQQQIGRPHVFEQFAMQAAFSNQGDKYVIGLTEFLNDTFPNVVDLFDFNRCTGYFSNPRHIEIPDTYFAATGCGFSPNGKLLYVNTNKDIYQFNTDSSNINASRIIIATWDTVANPYYKFYFQQLAPDGKIYLTNYVSADYLHVIELPDEAGSPVTQGGLLLPVVNTHVMPNAPNYSLGLLAGSGCDTLTNIKENEIFDLKPGVYPNPVLQNELITFSYTLPQNKEGKIEIFDVAGKNMYASRLSPWSSIHRIKAKLSAGLYSVKISSGTITGYLKFVVVE